MRSSAHPDRYAVQRYGARLAARIMRNSSRLNEGDASKWFVTPAKPSNFNGGKGRQSSAFIGKFVSTIKKIVPCHCGKCPGA